MARDLRGFVSDGLKERQEVVTDFVCDVVVAAEPVSGAVGVSGEDDTAVSGGGVLDVGADNWVLRSGSEEVVPRLVFLGFQALVFGLPRSGELAIPLRRWSEPWARWRKAVGWPKSGTFHSLRHFFATTLITNGVDPQEVQKAMRHASLRITLETYVHWWPKKDRPKGVLSGALKRARSDRDKEQDQKRLVPDLVPVI